MAGVAAIAVSVALGSTALKSSGEQKSIATFSGLKACTELRHRATLYRPAVHHRKLVIKAAASEKTMETVRGIIAKQLDVSASKVQADSKFSDMGADSLDTVEIMMAIEEEFNVSLDEDRAEKIDTVQEAADLIQTVLEPKA